MNNYILIGLGLAAAVLILSIAWSYVTHTGKRNETAAWMILTEAFNLPTKLIISGPTFFLLIITILLSMAVADGLHERMELAGWGQDIPYVVNMGLQMLGTLAFYLIPVMIALVLDSSMPRPGWIKPDVNAADATTANKAKLYTKQANKVLYSILGSGSLIAIGLIAAGSLDIISSAFAVSGTFFLLCFFTAVYIAVYGYYYAGSTYIEVMVLLLAVIVGIGVYSLDFYWNRLLTVDFVLNNLDYDNLSDLEINKAMQMAYQDYSNRTLLNIVLIIVDLFAAGWSLLNKEQLWFIRLTQVLAQEKIGRAKMAESDRLNPNANTNRSNNTNNNLVNNSTNNSNSNNSNGGANQNPPPTPNNDNTI